MIEYNKYEALKNAIDCFQVENVKEIIRNFTKEDIHNPELLHKYSNETNFLNQVLYNLNNLNKKMNAKDMKSFIEIIEMICFQFNHLIDLESYTYPNEYKNVELIKILNKYYIGKIEDKSCYVCYSKSSNYMIDNSCNCLDKHVHLFCFINEIRKDECKKCYDCNHKYNIYPYIHGTMFPELNIFISPLRLCYIFVDESNLYTQFYYAIIYLMKSKIEQIVKKMKKTEFRIILSQKYYDNIIDYSTYSINKTIKLLNTTGIYSEKHYPELFDKINSLLLEKCIECMDYECNYDIKLSYGIYIWCGNSMLGSGFTFLTDINNVNEHVKDSFMINLEINMNLKLFKDTELIEIYDDEGFLFHYSFLKINEKYTCFKKINEKYFGKELIIHFLKFKPYQINQARTRKQTEKIYSSNIIIPTEFKIYGNEKICNICLEDINENKYITPCGHLFHTQCMINYFEAKDLLNNVHIYCKNSCCNSKKIKPFQCVVCKYLIEK
jgi:hypothetical protein